ncbi:MAG TPA: hypothetical protein VJ783_09580 [Pirellulales bacterium]|nr:hypothetical protein [Pirellulales bacterium]
MADEFTYDVLGCPSWDELDDNVDIQITLSDGRRYTATFFTLRNLESLFEKNRMTGECAGGIYLWACDMILVKRLDHETIRATIADLISSDELDSACLQIMAVGGVRLTRGIKEKE